MSLAKPLHWAVLNRNETAVRVLVEFGADVDRKDSRFLTPLLQVCCESAGRDAGCLELLLALGADCQAACQRAVTKINRLALCALVAAGGNLDQPDNTGIAPRVIENVALPSADEIDVARRRIAKTRLDLVRHRAFQICVGLQPLDIDALQLCEIVMHSFGAIGALIAFHQWWEIATKVKHFRDHKQAI
jgi:hypothetical protein